MSDSTSPLKKLSALESFIDETRVMNFSDSVFAFAATLLVLKIELPALMASQLDSQLWPAITHLWPQYFANFVSFFIIGYYWLSHHSVFTQMKKMNGRIVWLNTLFLIFLSFLPFPVDLYGSFHMNPAVIAFYSLSVSVVGFWLAALWLSAQKMGLLTESLTKKQTQLSTIRYFLMPVIFLLATPIAFVHPLLAQLAWIGVVVGEGVLRKR